MGTDMHTVEHRAAEMQTTTRRSSVMYVWRCPPVILSSLSVVICIVGHVYIDG
jgi:hypothetical protein